MHIDIYRPTVLENQFFSDRAFVTLPKVTQMHFCQKQKMRALRGLYGT